MPGGPIGTIYAEIDLDPSRYISSQKRLYEDATRTTLNIEENFRKLGIKSSYEMDLMRAKITNAYNMIANSSKATANDIIRAEEAKNAKLKALNEAQFGHQTTLLQKLKEHWLAISATVYSIYRVARIGQGWVKEADEIGKVADALDLSTKSLQEYQYSARLSGVETEAFNRSVEQLTKRLGELRAGTGELEYKLKDMNTELLNQLKTTTNTDQALELIFKTLDKTENALDRNALAAAAFGRSGVKMVNMVRGGYEELKKMRDEAQSLGVVLDEDLIRRSEEINDKFETMYTIVKTQLTGAFIALAPSVLKVGKGLSAIARAIGDVNREMEQLSTYESFIAKIMPVLGVVAGSAAGPYGMIAGGIGGGLLGNMIGASPAGETQEEMKRLWDLVGGKKHYIDVYAQYMPQSIPVLPDQYWQDLTKNIEKSWLKGMEGALYGGKNLIQSFFEDTGRIFVSQIFQGFSADYMRPIFNQMAGGVHGFLNMPLWSPVGPNGPLNVPTYGNLLGAGGFGYGIGGIGGGIGGAAGFMAGSALMPLTMIGGPLGMLAGAGLGGLLGGSFGDEGPSEFTKMRRQFYKGIKESLISGISEGFKAGMESGGFQEFKDSFKTSIRDIIINSLAQSFATAAMGPILEQFKGYFDLINKYNYQQTHPLPAAKINPLTGKPFTLDPNYLLAQSSLYNPMITPEMIGASSPGENVIEDYLAQIEPMFDSFIDAVGLNTDALKENTEAIIGPVEAFLRELTTGSLAPALSYEGMQAMYEKLFNEAVANPQSFSTFAGYARSDYIPFMKEYGIDYSQLTSSIISGVKSIPWYQQAKQNVEVKVYLDSQELKSSFRSLLRDADVRDDIARIRG